MKKGSLAATMGFLSALSAVWAYAEESPGSAAQPERSDLQEIIVTARRKEERQQNVPLAITTLSGDFLKENSIVGLHDLNGQVPGLNVENFNSPAYTNVGIRGQRNNNIAPGQDAAVGYYISEVSYGYAWLFLAETGVNFDNVLRPRRLRDAEYCHDEYRNRLETFERT